MTRQIFVLGLVSFFAAACLPHASIMVSRVDGGESRSDREATKHASDLVHEALNAEAKGDLTLRKQLLDQSESIATVPVNQWHRGMVRDPSGQWTNVAEVISQVPDDRRIDSYEHLRANTPASLDGQWKLAAWCAGKGMWDQARSHLNQILAMDYDNRLARTALGYRWVNREWVSPSELEKYQHESEAAHESVARHGGAVRAIAKQLSSKNEAVRQQAMDSIAELTDPDLVPVIESVFHPRQALSSVTIQWLASIDSPSSSLGLSKYALFNDDPQIRALAVERLKDCPLHDFVPSLLAMMATPIRSSMAPSFDGRGNLVGYAQSFSQEKFDSTDLISNQIRFRNDSGNPAIRQVLPIRVRDDAGNPEDRQVLQMWVTLAQNPATQWLTQLPETISQEEIRLENKRIQIRNDRIGNLVADVGNISYNGDVKELWSWWDLHNETAYQDFKLSRYQSYQNEYVIPAPTIFGGQFASFGVQFAGECFVAGTPIVTQRGMKAIDEILVGDVVLSRNITTGELDWKPVLRTTRRPPEPTVILSVGGEQLQCTTGHLLWVSGAGWKKASDLQPGNLMHGAREPITLDKVNTAGDEATFNLDVADFGTYFVGNNMILSHDVKPRTANRGTVPGISYHFHRLTAK